MKNASILLTGALGAVALIYSRLPKKPDTRTSVFIGDAILQCTLINETAKLALQKSLASDVKNYAQQMLDDYAPVNEMLIAAARKRNIKVTHHNKSPGSDLLRYKTTDPFDAIYIRHQLDIQYKLTALVKCLKQIRDRDIAQLSSSLGARLDRYLPAAKHLARLIKHQSLTATPSFEAERDDTP